MSEPDPKTKDKPTPPAETPTDELAPIIIDWGKSEVDPGIKSAIDNMTAQNTKLMQSNEQLTKIIQDMNTKSALEDYTKLKEVKLAELEEIKPGMAEKYKDEKDLGLIDNAIKVLKELNKDDKFSDIKGDDPDSQKEPTILEQHWKDPMKKPPA